MGRPSVKERAAFDVESITDVAVRVFNERGFDGASMEHVAQAAGITKSSLYHHVASKEELLRRGVTRALDALFALLEEPELRRGRASERLKHVIRRTVEAQVPLLPEVALLLRVRGNTATERWALARRRQFDKVVKNLILQAIEEGDVRPDLDAGIAARLVFGMSNSLTEWYRPRARVGPKEIADSILKILFEGLRRKRNTETR